MCVAVTVEDISPQAPRWDHDSVTIHIGRGLDHFTALKQVRAMLAWLGAPQPGTGAQCWCGAPVTLPNVSARIRGQADSLRIQAPAGP